MPIIPETTLPEELERLKRARRAICALIKTSGRSTAAEEARKLGHQAYKECFTESERSRVVAAARQRQVDAPPHSFMLSVPPISTFDDATSTFGTSLIVETLGDEA